MKKLWLVRIFWAVTKGDWKIGGWRWGRFSKDRIGFIVGSILRLSTRLTTVFVGEGVIYEKLTLVEELSDKEQWGRMQYPKISISKQIENQPVRDLDFFAGSRDDFDDCSLRHIEGQNGHDDGKYWKGNLVSTKKSFWLNNEKKLSRGK